MTRHLTTFAVLLVAGTCFVRTASAQYSTPPLSAKEKERIYNFAIEKRTSDILDVLSLTDPDKIQSVHDTIVTQYHALRDRDDALDKMFKALSKDSPDVETNRLAILRILSRTLHNNFLIKLARYLTPEQIEKVKDKMTYGKVEVTYHAYDEIVPGLTDSDKAKIMELLKDAREEAIDGGSADEKSAIFQVYKDRINAYLDAHGHDVAQAYRDWNAKQEMAKKQEGQTATPEESN